MKIAFLTEMNFCGTISRDYKNMRTEFAWMNALQAEHFPLTMYQQVHNYDLIIIIWPKGNAITNAEGYAVTLNKVDNFAKYSNLPIIETLKQSNERVAFMQEGAAWFFNDYSIVEQINHYNIMHDSDIIFAHNKYDTLFYKGLFPTKPISIMPTLMFGHNLVSQKLKQENRTIIGGNFCRWYGGFQSYIIASLFDTPIDAPTMHNKREHEEQLGIHHLPYMDWTSWNINLSRYKYAVHMIPVAIAGTFALNCAFWGIPCIGNKNIDTQAICHPDLSIDVHDVYSARMLALELKNSNSFYDKCSKKAITLMNENYNEQMFLKTFNSIF